MFTRTPPSDPKTPQPRKTSGTAADRALFGAAAAPATTDKSVIGNDLRIIGQGLKIIGRGVLQVDGEIEGDVQGAEVIVGEKGKVTGMVAAQNVIIRGTVSGVVCGKAVALQASSHVEGDLHHMSLAVVRLPCRNGHQRAAAASPLLTANVRLRAREQS
jgi:cytoskeletal protein CcmA (bactofilin family)